MTNTTKTDTLILLLLLVVRVAPAMAVGLFGDGNGLSGHFDQSVYVWGADAILRTGTNSFNFFPPLQFLFIAAFLHLCHGAVGGALIAGAAVGWLTVVVIYLMGKHLFDRPTALLAAVLCGIYPGFIAYGLVLSSETLAIFFIVCSFWLLVLYLETDRYQYLIGAALLWALAAQTRGGLHYFIVGICLGLILQPAGRSLARAWKSAALFACISLAAFFAIGLAVAPVHGNAAFNSKSGMGSVVHGVNRITTSCADYGNIRGNIFYDINNTGEPWPADTALFPQIDIVQSSTLEILAAVWEFICEDPMTYLVNGLKKLSCMWTPNQYAIDLIKTRFYYRHADMADLACLAISIFYLLALCGGTWGTAASRDPLRLFFVLFVLFYVALIFVTVGNSKLRMPLMPLFMLYCAASVVTIAKQPRRAWRTLRTPWVAICIIAVIGNAIYKYPEILLSPAEINVRKIELCADLGFPRTAVALYKRVQHFTFYDPGQRQRMLEAYQAARQATTAPQDPNSAPAAH